MLIVNNFKLGRIVTAITAICLLNCFRVSAVWAEKVTLVLSHKHKLYEEVCQPFEKDEDFAVEKIYLSENYEEKAAAVLAITPSQADVIVAIGAKAAGLAADINSEIPVIYTLVYEPMKYSKRKAAGVIIQISLREQIAGLRKLFPDRKYIGVIFNPEFSSRQVNEARILVREYGFRLLAIPVDKREEIAKACDRFSSGSVDILLMVADQMIAHPKSLQVLVKYSKKQKIPLIGLSEYHVKNGAAVAFTVDFNDIGKQIVDMIRKGLDSTDNLVEYPRKVDILVNSTVKKQMELDDLVDLPENIYIP